MTYLLLSNCSRAPCVAELVCCQIRMAHTCDNVDQSASSDSHVTVELQSASPDEILTMSHLEPSAGQNTSHK